MKYIVLFSLFLLVVGCGNEDSKGDVGRYTLVTQPYETTYQDIRGNLKPRMTSQLMLLDTKTGKIYRYYKGWTRSQTINLNTEGDDLPLYDSVIKTRN